MKFLKHGHKRKENGPQRVCVSTQESILDRDNTIYFSSTMPPELEKYSGYSLVYR